MEINASNIITHHTRKQNQASVTHCDHLSDVLSRSRSMSRIASLAPLVG